MVRIKTDRPQYIVDQDDKVVNVVTGNGGGSGSTAGPAGPPGNNGSNGKSAYELAVQNGFVGTEVQWLASLEGPEGDPGSPGAPGSDADVQVVYANLARTPDSLISGTVTRDANGAATSAPVTWPDGSPGTYTALTLSTSFPGAVDSYQITYGSPVTKTYTQPAVTRDYNGAVVTVPAIVVT